METLISFDTETGGIERGSRMVELAGVRFNTQGVLSIFETLVNPGMPIPPDATKLHGITDDMVADAPTAGDALQQWLDWMGDDRHLVGHYALYDTGIISWEASRAGIVLPDNLLVLDTCEVAKEIKATKRNGLDCLVEHYGIERRGQAHRALCDADACRQYLMRMRETEQFSTVFKPFASAGHDYEYCLPPFELDHHVHSGEPFTFGYTDKDGETTERTVIPYGWAARNGECYFHGWCTLRQARREFRADRVTLLETA